MKHEDPQEKLTECRRLIDRIDSQLVALLNERTRIVQSIGALKQQLAMPIYEPKREEEVFRNVAQSNHGPLAPDAVRRIFERMIDEMRTVQKSRSES